MSTKSKLMMQVVLLLVLLAFKLTTYGAFGWNPNHVVQASWEDENSDDKLLHLTIDEQSGQKRVYVGAVNNIYQLSSDLKLEAQAIMGPAPDDYECPITRNCPNIERKPMTYYNKALVIYIPNSSQTPTATFPVSPYSTRQQQQQQQQSFFSSSSSLLSSPSPPSSPRLQQPVLISCGTLYQGSCALHNLDNITQFQYPANESVVANSPTASTVAFIAPGPEKSPLSRSHPVLYVGSSYTGLGRNEEVPPVSSRSLLPDSIFNFAASGVSTGTRLTVSSFSRNQFPINYVYGFSSRGFSYFVTVQKKSSASTRPFITKLVRICQKDLNYHSYVEIPLLCRTEENGLSNERIEYNLAQAAYVGHPGLNLAKSLDITTNDEVLYVAFAKSSDKRDVYNEPSQQSALCVYALPSIHRSFTQNIQSCFNGFGQHGLDFIGFTEPCIQTQVQITEDFCGMDVNNLISGSVPIETSPLIEFKNVSLTAVAASPTNDFTVAYLGTSTGKLKRLAIEDDKLAIEYSESVIDPLRRTPINADMRFDRRDKNADFIYVMNDKKVSLIKVQECNSYKSCNECLGAYDPHCGWCSLENRCSVKSSCAEANQDSLYWLSYRSGKCTTITSVVPPQIQVTTVRTLTIGIDNLPNVDARFLCAFTAQGRTEITNAAKISRTAVSCETPPTEALPPLSTTNHDLTTKLSVRMINGTDFTATNFTFFDCSTYSTCTDCVSSPHPCDWCVSGHRCTHDTGEYCRSDILITGIKQVGSSQRSGPSHCPRILPSDNNSSEILVSTGQQRRVQVQIRELPSVIASSRFSCQFNIEGRVRQVNAQLLSNIVYCDLMEFAYTKTATNITVSFAVIWGNSNPLDNPENIHILVYQCSAMADNCGFCLELPPKYSCGWCKDTNSCQISEHCSTPPLLFGPQEICPNPQITSFEPISGPHEGGTNITIRGINLGRTFEDIKDSVTLDLIGNEAKIGQIECVPYRESYVRTSQITCQLGSPVNSSIQSIIPGIELSAVISVRVSSEYVARSLGRYNFVNPHITSVVPSKGPKSGGTQLMIWGLDMNAGSKAEIYVGNLPCQIVNRLPDKAECLTSPAEHPGEQRVSMRFDNAERIFHDYNFLYVDSPDIELKTESNGLNPSKIPYEGPHEGLEGTLSRSVLFMLISGASFLVLVVIFILIAYRRKASESNRVVKTMQEQMDVLEMKVASEAKQAFTELQTEMTDLTDDLEHGGIPYLDYRIYTMKVLFPSSSDHPVLSEMQIDPKIRPSIEKGLASFGQLILNKTFLLLFIRTLESNRYFSMRDRVNVASLIMVTLQNRMEYCTDILKTLLADLIEKSMEVRSHPKLLLRRTESVAEKMLSSWFTFLLYKFLRECAGEPLFLLYQAIKHQVNKGPVDVITSEARCSLSEEKLIRQSVDYKPLTVFVSISPQTACLSGVDPNIQTENFEMPVKVLDCDTISQVKEKAIDAIYKSTPYSLRPSKDHLDIEWRATQTARVLMSDEDHTTKTEGYWRRLNTLAHYRVPDNASLMLVAKQTSQYNMSMLGDKHRYETLSHFGLSNKTLSSTISRPTSPLNELDSGYKHWHLVRHHDNDYRDGERSGKMVSEIYLTRLLATKGTLQRFVDDLFETIFSTARLTSSLPIAIKYMFDFLDDQARGHGITDPEVVHTWKSNSLPLRFWVNLIKNPNFVFDINKSNIVDSCLSVVAQTFMDACSTSEHRLGKDSPSSKLLYAKDLPIYKDWVERYYNEIAMMPPINEHDMNAMLAEESRQHAHEFNTNVSLHELFKYAVKYQEQLMTTLDEDEFGRKFKLAAKLRQTMLIMNGDNNVLLQV